MSLPAHQETRPSDLTARFAAAMESFAPFESQPHLGIAVSGGADSTALAVLAVDWARRRGGRVTGLIVDHRLRSESTCEAALVGARLKALGADAIVLTWQGSKPQTGLQAAARAARYALLGDWCRANGVLHLLVAHHADDQSETIAMRRARRSGPVGLAGMSAVVEQRGLRLLRPLLAAPKAALVGFLRALAQPWIEDPSNLDPRFERTLLRGRHAAMALPDEDRRAGLLRARIEVAAHDLLANAATLHPLGVAKVDLDVAAPYPPGVAVQALGAVLTWAGGLAHPPAPAVLARTWHELQSLTPGKALTLVRCHLRRRCGHVVVVREARGYPPSFVVVPGMSCLWDGRFEIAFDGPPGGTLRVASLGLSGAAVLLAQPACAGVRRLPILAVAGLPALWSSDGPVSAPGFADEADREWQFLANYRPRRTLFSPTFAVA